ncbi:hypothetical protein RHMOL_Rhmol02G0046700 [Rhododendron molle]|uniref:Uncharacterized protein n=1 Tax=Rhododendron molle TaxID=49168 RepID=A0ACC0PP62_RHOML|nr:hypothetical protein RHMOL_Rhmol02G0046700 [Rhododendron molle]
MSHHHPRRIQTPSASRKRKEMEALYPRKPPAPPFAAATTTAPFKAPAEPAAPSNRLLAGYMAHEFLTKGTLLGQKWDPARAEALPVSNGSGEPKRAKPAEEAEPSRKGKREKHDDCDDERYAEVARLLKEDGAHVAGIVNPTQLTRWIQM